MPQFSAAPVHDVALPFPLVRRGKVRDVYDLGDALLLVASDRLSAFDVVLPDPIARKGETLTQLSAWWFMRAEPLVAHHLLSADPHRILELHPELEPHRPRWERRSMLVRALQPVRAECVVRGYLAGSGWKEYRTHGTLAGEPLPTGLRQWDHLPAPVFAPAAKAESGHDENISYQRFVQLVGTTIAETLRDRSLALYGFGAEQAAKRGILLADTKFEFGLDGAGEPVLIDELLTPDSSRFWPAATFRPGETPESLDKQPVRDFLQDLIDAGEWDGKPPGPSLPAEVIARTTERYLDAFKRLTGSTLDRFVPAEPAARR